MYYDLLARMNAKFRIKEITVLGILTQKSMSEIRISGLTFYN